MNPKNIFSATWNILKFRSDLISTSCYIVWTKNAAATLATYAEVFLLRLFWGLGLSLVLLLLHNNSIPCVYSLWLSFPPCTFPLLHINLERWSAPVHVIVSPLCKTIINCSPDAVLFKTLHWQLTLPFSFEFPYCHLLSSCVINSCSQVWLLHFTTRVPRGQLERWWPLI